MTPNVDPRATEEIPPRQHTQLPRHTPPTDPICDLDEVGDRRTGRLAGQRALITSGDTDIGRAVSLAFAREGADVAMAYPPSEQRKVADTQSQVEDTGQRCLLLPGDLREGSDCSDAVQRTIAELGGLDVLVLNGGEHSELSTETVESKEILDVFTTNLVAPLALMCEAAPHLKPGASVIVTASIQSYPPSTDLLDHAMTKAALVAFTRALAEDQGKHGVRVNAVAPGPIRVSDTSTTELAHETDATDAESLAKVAKQAAELAGTYVYLASEDASSVSGTILPVTSGNHH